MLDEVALSVNTPKWIRLRYLFAGPTFFIIIMLLLMGRVRAQVGPRLRSGPTGRPCQFLPNDTHVKREREKKKKTSLLSRALCTERKKKNSLEGLLLGPNEGGRREFGDNGCGEELSRGDGL